ncbi:MAG: hypothetical protein AB1744_13375 [Candidatus Zixiibacteriota bacterium]
MKRIGLILILAFQIVSLRADETTQTGETADTLVTVSEKPPRYTITIERLTVQNAKLNDTIDVILSASGNDVAAFDLILAVEYGHVSIDTVLPGEICDSCRWQFFNSRPARTSGSEKMALSAWQAVALAELMTDDSSRPVCYGMDRPASLVRLVVSSPVGLTIPDTVVPVFFYWQDCTDNTLSGVSGDLLMMSADVFDHNGEPVGQDSEFPTRSGAPPECIDPSARNRPERRIDFHCGAIRFKLSLGEEATDSLPATTGNDRR